MKNRSNFLLSGAELVLAVLTLVSRGVIFAAGFGAAAYALLGITALTSAVLIADGIRAKEYPSAFGSGELKMKACAYLLSFGFLTDMVNRCLSIYYLFEDGRYYLGFYLFARAFTALFALLSAVYFILVGLSFGSGRYDFRFLKVLHIVPMLWALARIIEITEQAGLDINNGFCDLFIFLTLALSMLFFNSFAREVESSENTHKATVVFSKLLSYYSLLCAFELLLELIRPSGEYMGYELFFGITALTLCVFSYAFQGRLNTEI